VADGSPASTRVELSLARGIRTAAARWPDRVAIEMGEARLSYRALAGLLARTANLAAGLGLEPGDRVAFVSGNRPDFVAIVAGLAEAGIIVATLGDRLTTAELAGILADCAPRLVLGDAGSPAEAAAAAAGIDFFDLLRRWPALLEAASEAPRPAALREADAFGLSYTSGTTGAPKGVMLTHRSRSLTFMAMAAEYGCFGSGDRFLVLTPMSHGAGFVFGVAPLFFGGTSVILETGDPERIAARLAQPDLTGVFLVPTQLSRLATLPPARLSAGGALKSIISNASALAQPLKEMVIETYGPGLLHETYGSTEAGIVTNIRPDELLAKPGSVGTPFPLIEVSLRDEAGAEVPPGVPGELFVRGPYAFGGYWNAPAPTAEAIVDGWVTVGDMASRDADGFITIVDRKKDMVVSGGLNVYPREVELVLATVPGVRDVAVVGVPDPEWGERLHAFVVGAAAPDALKAAARASLAPHKVPKGFSFLDELPRGPTGKVLKRELRQQSAANPLAEPSP
jgi:long-chain acyl-CoA synthetase